MKTDAVFNRWIALLPSPTAMTRTPSAFGQVARMFPETPSPVCWADRQDVEAAAAALGGGDGTEPMALFDAAVSARSSGVARGAAFASLEGVRRFAASRLASGDRALLERMTGGDPGDGFDARLDEAARDPDFARHWRETAADHFAFHVIDTLSRLTGSMPDTREIFVSSDFLTADIASLPFFCFLAPRERWGANG
jgi:hypothetical protein